MNLFDDNCRIVAEYDKDKNGVNMEVVGGAGDVCALLASIVDQVAGKLHITGAALACRIGTASDNMRRITDKATIIDLDAIQRAKDKRDGS